MLGHVIAVFVALENGLGSDPTHSPQDGKGSAKVAPDQWITSGQVRVGHSNICKQVSDLTMRAGHLHFRDPLHSRIGAYEGIRCYVHTTLTGKRPPPLVPLLLDPLSYCRTLDYRVNRRN